MEPEGSGMKVATPTAIDLFCGCGGMTEGLKQAGYSVVWGVDAAPKPLQTYAKNHPEVSACLADIREVDCDALCTSLKMRPGDLDLLAGCPPCQGFSSMRTRNGAFAADDARNDLVNEFLRFVIAFRPRAVMLENVPGLRRDSRFQAFVSDMVECGYAGDWDVLDAADYGVSQRRKRLIYVAARNRGLRVVHNTVPRRTVRDAIAGLPPAGASGDPLHDAVDRRTDRIRRMIELIPSDGGSRSDLPDEYVLPCHRRNPDGFHDVYGRMSWDKPAPTITGGCASPSKGRFLHPQENRCITLREAATLQGFPPSYVFDTSGVPKHEVALMIGNALPVPFIRAHAESIRSQLAFGVEEA